MGLGKTLQSLGLILSNPPKGHVYGTGNGSLITQPVATLIVCPMSVISNWQQQIDKFVEPNTFRVMIYTGTPMQRSKLVLKLKNNEIDILLASYNTINVEFGKKKMDKSGNPLVDIHGVSFHRVILDEAQVIRNSQSKCFRAISAIAAKSEFRLALTGTPFVNKPDDIHSLLSFVGLAPLSDPKFFKDYIANPIQNRKRAGLTRLRAGLAYVALRRTKNVVKLNIAEKTIYMCHVDFPDNSEHKRIHDCLFQMAAIAQYPSIEMVLRVRQSCASGALVPTRCYPTAAAEMKQLKTEDGRMKRCMTQEGNKMINKLQAANAVPETALVVRDRDIGPSPKISALMGHIEKMAIDEKGVIFSQWTSFLDLIQDSLVTAGHKIARIDGTMKSESCTKAMQLLDHDDNVRFILCSLKAAGTGINLTRASVVFMMEPWWNDAVEMQAIDRCHRLGQTRPVRVYRFVMKGTIEECMITIQQSKAVLGKGAMHRLTAEEKKSAKTTALKDFFRIKSGNIHDLEEEAMDDWC
eukprot:scaffold62436_cov59-Attheya_sp.AAC.1